MVEYLLRMHVVLDSNLSTRKEKFEASINSRKGRKENELQQKEKNSFFSLLELLWSLVPSDLKMNTARKRSWRI